MTYKKDFKKLVRERMAKTGESFMTARRHVLAKGQGSTEAKRRVAPGNSVHGVVLSTAPELERTYPVADLGVTHVRWARISASKTEGVYFFVPVDAPSDREEAVIQRLRERWTDNGIELVVVRGISMMATSAGPGTTNKPCFAGRVKRSEFI